jgi:hypothetical protein
MTNQNELPKPDALEQALAALRRTPVSPGPPPQLVASTIETVQSRVSEQAITRRQERRKRMFRIARYSSLAAAAALLAIGGIALWVLDRSAAPAFGQVIEKVKESKSAIFNLRQKILNGPQLEQIWYIQGDGMRMEMPGKQGALDAGVPLAIVAIADLRQKKALQIDYVSKTVEKLTFDRQLAKELHNPLDGFRKLTDQDAERIADEVLNGRPTRVYQLRKIDFFGARGKVEKGETAKVWVDPASGLPVRILLDTFAADHKGKITLEFVNFSWNQQIDPNLFRLDIPQGFTVKKK